MLGFHPSVYPPKQSCRHSHQAHINRSSLLAIFLCVPHQILERLRASWSCTTATSAHSVGFGKAATGAFYPTIYVSGTVNGSTALFRSTDVGKTWVQINDAQHQWGWRFAGGR